MAASSFRKFVIALAVASVATVGCTVDPAAATVATDAAVETTPDDAGVAAQATDAVACADDDIGCQEALYQLEETLFMYEAGVAKQIGEPAHACWQSDSDAFRQSLDACTDVECRLAALRDRIASLHFLQPESGRATLDLPEVPLLLAVLGPETEASPPPGPPAPLEVHGGLVHASANVEHMGIAVRDGNGADHVFILDMDIGNQPGHDEVLGLVGTSPTAQVMVRGHRHVAPDGVADFAASRCRLVYQLP